MTASLLFILALGGGDLPPSAPSVAPDVKLHSPLLEGARLPLAATLRLARAQPVPAPPAPTAPPMSATTSSNPEAQSGTCDIECDACREADRTSRYLYRHRGSNLRAHRAFALAALGSLVVAQVFDTIIVYNQPSWFGEGHCSAPGASGDFGCASPNTLVGIHAGLTIVTTGLYTTSAVLAFAAPDPDGAASGGAGASRTIGVHKVLAWIHGTGMVLLPVLGLLANNPQTIGVDPDPAGDFQRGMRTLHTIVGYTTLVALTTAAVIEF